MVRFYYPSDCHSDYLAFERIHAFFLFQAEDGIRAYKVTGVQTWALPVSRCSSLQPLRVLTVTGRWVAPMTARMIRSTRSMSRRQPDPPFRWTTFLTGQPKLMS